MDYRPTIQSPATAKDDLIDILTSLNPTDLAGPTGPTGPTDPTGPTGPTNPTAKKAPDGTPNSWKDVLRCLEKEKDLWIKALFKEFEQLLDTKVF
ncbi:hypothetical protein UVI_02057180 [Ustilaginoidea virens]|uniref:Uncharacterized protein n=1 Tax=Ustilaginoidea virens TaxID=1159556 RepID=A0A1B5V944_USTVR|nr:hypothetical protein UVI_02057180 [Ustilaginoidea virens]